MADKIIRAMCSKDKKKIKEVFNEYIFRDSNRSLREFIYKATTYAYHYNMDKYGSNDIVIFCSFILVTLDKPYWKSVDTYEKLQKGIISFLKGKKSTSMFHLGPIFRETIKLTDDLIEINKLGFVSLQGQPGDCVYNQPGEITSFEQVSFIAGFYPRKKRDALGNMLAKKGFVATNAEAEEVYGPHEYQENFKIKWNREKLKNKRKWGNWEFTPIDFNGNNYPSETGNIYNEKLKKWASKNLDTWAIYDTVECRERLVPELISILKKLA